MSCFCGWNGWELYRYFILVSNNEHSTIKIVITGMIKYMCSVFSLTYKIFTLRSTNMNMKKTISISPSIDYPQNIMASLHIYTNSHLLPFPLVFLPLLLVLILHCSDCFNFSYSYIWLIIMKSTLTHSTNSHPLLKLWNTRCSLYHYSVVIKWHDV